MGFRIIKSNEKRPHIDMTHLRELVIAEIASKWDYHLGPQSHIVGSKEFIEKITEINAKMDAQTAWDTLEKIKHEWGNNNKGARLLQANISTSKLIELL